MPTEVQIRSITDSLAGYHSQLVALSQALDALRVVADHMIVAVEKDRAALGTYEVSAPHVQFVDDAAAASAETVERLESGSVERAPTAETGILTASAYDGAAVTVETPVADDKEAIIAAALAQVAAELRAAAEAEQSTAAVFAAALADAPEVVATGADTVAAPAAVATVDDNVVSLEARRAQRNVAIPARRRAMALASGLLIAASATLGLHELMQTELGQRLIEFGACNGDMMSASRDCALLAWMLI